jgi:hypothetical protein
MLMLIWEDLFKMDYVCLKCVVNCIQLCIDIQTGSKFKM